MHEIDGLTLNAIELTYTLDGVTLIVSELFYRPRRFHIPLVLLHRRGRANPLPRLRMEYLR